MPLRIAPHAKSLNANRRVTKRLALLFHLLKHTWDVDAQGKLGIGALLLPELHDAEHEVLRCCITDVRRTTRSSDVRDLDRHIQTLIQNIKSQTRLQRFAVQTYRRRNLDVLHNRTFAVVDAVGFF
jgi:hypothetical protein